MSHRSRLRAVMIDVPDPGFAAAAAFWATALGRDRGGAAEDADPYLRLLPDDTGVRVTLQRIDEQARVHLDIETDDVEAEVRRLQAAGATVVGHVEDWVVMTDPTGLRFCVVPVDGRDFPRDTAEWP